MTYRSSQSQERPPAAPRPGIIARVQLAWVVGGLFFLATLYSGVVYGWRSGQVPAQVHTVRYTVRPGDTLYTIAAEVAGSGNVLATQDWIEQRNHVDAAAIQPGMKIWVPVR